MQAIVIIGTVMPGSPADDRCRLDMSQDLRERVDAARWERARIAALLVEGSCDIQLLFDYRRWMTVSRLLGDISEGEALASMARAEQVLAANCEAAQPT